jgi:perosamine synthetase
MQEPNAHFDWPLADEEVQAALDAAYRDGSWGRYRGPHSDGLVEDLRAQFACEHALLCSSGTIGLELALRGCGVAVGDEVVLAAYDFPGNFRAVEAVGARPVLVDVAPDTWCLDVGQLAEISRPGVKAVIVSHLHGGLADMQALMNLARERAWAVVEDACQQPGAKLQGRAVGSWGDVSVLSFGGSKLLTAGRGGAILTHDAQILQRVKVFADRGNQAFPLSELQAVVLRPQLARLTELNQIRAQRVTQILQQTKELAPWLRPVTALADSEPAYFKLAWSFVPAEERPELRDQLLAKTEEAGMPFGAGFRGFTGRSQRRCEKPLPLPWGTRLSQSTILLHHPVLLAHEKAAQGVIAVLNQLVRQLV